MSENGESKPEFRLDFDDDTRAMHAAGLDGVADTATALATALRTRDDCAAVVHLSVLALSGRPISRLLDDFLLSAIRQRFLHRREPKATGAGTHMTTPAQPGT